jgi:hypothetical protein
VDSNRKYPVVTAEGVDRILNAVHARHPILPKKGSTLEERKAALLVSLNWQQNHRKKWDSQFKFHGSKRLPKKLERIEAKAKALASELGVSFDRDGGVTMDRFLLSVLALHAKLHTAEQGHETERPDKSKRNNLAQKNRQRSYPYLKLISNSGYPSFDLGKIDIANSADIVADAIEGVLLISRLPVPDIQFGEWYDSTRSGETMLVAYWLPGIYTDFFPKDFPKSKNSRGPGIRFVHSAYAEMVHSRKDIGTIAQMCFRYRK